MPKNHVRLIDVLSPPENPWLKEISLRKTGLPVGVCIVRFNDDDSDDPLDQSVLSSLKLTHMPLRHAA